MNCDLEIRYALGRGDSGVYVYAIFSHPEDYGPLNMPESRFITKINQTFDWISVDADRNMLQCAPRDWGTGVVVHAKEQRILTQGVYKNSVEHKYSYNAVQYKIPAYGWSSTKDHVGIWFINPTIEYLSGGASKQELVCHFGDNANPDPIILNYWRGTHYGGGATCNVAAGEKWSKVIGPIFVYVNSLDSFQTPTQADLDTLAATAGNPTVPAAWKNNATALWQDALRQAKAEKAKWPYDWVEGVDYPHKKERGTVTGRLVLNDPQAATTKLPHLTVGLAHPVGAAATRTARDWVHDAKYYQFWNDGAEDGKFTITNVRPGELHAARVRRRRAGRIRAGRHHRRGRQDAGPEGPGVEAGAPRQAGLGDRLPHARRRQVLQGRRRELLALGLGPALPAALPERHHLHHRQERLPQGLVLPADAARDVDGVDEPGGEGSRQPAIRLGEGRVAEGLSRRRTPPAPGAVYGRGRATTWTIKFNMDHDPKGEAALRVALAGADGNGGLAIAVNGKAVGTLRPTATNALRYNTNKSVWQELTLKFDAALLKQGENEMTAHRAGRRSHDRRRVRLPAAGTQRGLTRRRYASHAAWLVKTLADASMPTKQGDLCMAAASTGSNLGTGSSPSPLSNLKHMAPTTAAVSKTLDSAVGVRVR